MQMQIIIEKFLRSEKSHSLNLNARERILMVILASYLGNKQECWPSYESLMKDCGMAKATLRKTIKSLINKNLIKIKTKHRKNNIYSFLSSHLELNNTSRVHTVNSNINIKANNKNYWSSHLELKNSKPVDNFKQRTSDNFEKHSPNGEISSILDDFRKENKKSDQNKVIS